MCDMLVYRTMAVHACNFINVMFICQTGFSSSGLMSHTYSIPMCLCRYVQAGSLRRIL